MAEGHLKIWMLHCNNLNIYSCRINCTSKQTQVADSECTQIYTSQQWITTMIFSPFAITTNPWIGPNYPGHRISMWRQNIHSHKRQNKKMNAPFFGWSYSNTMNTFILATSRCSQPRAKQGKINKVLGIITRAHSQTANPRTAIHIQGVSRQNEGIPTGCFPSLSAWKMNVFPVTMQHQSQQHPVIPGMWRSYPEKGTESRD